jgi:hypothetical protein
MVSSANDPVPTRTGSPFRPGSFGVLPRAGSRFTIEPDESDGGAGAGFGTVSAFTGRSSGGGGVTALLRGSFFVSSSFFFTSPTMTSASVKSTVVAAGAAGLSRVAVTTVSFAFPLFLSSPVTAYGFTGERRTSRWQSPLSSHTTHISVLNRVEREHSVTD